MIDKGANIDLLFRNGLKDLEVLPPVHLWNNLLPFVSRRQLFPVYLRAAAAVAAVITISFLAYRWNRDMTASKGNTILAVNEESVRSGPVSRTTPDVVKAIRVNPGAEKSAAVKVEDKTDAVVPDDESIQLPMMSYGTLTGWLAEEEKIVLPAGAGTTRGFIYKPSSEVFAGNEPEGITYQESKARTDKWSLIASASPTYYLRQGLGKDDMSRQLSSSEQSQISYSGGFGLSYKISSKLSIQSGLYYSSIGREIDGINSFAGFRQYDYTKGDHNFEVMTSSGLIYTDNTDIFLLDNAGDRVSTIYTNDVFDPAKANLNYLNSSLYQNFSYLEMPVILKYKVIDKTIDLNLIGGLSYNLLITNSVRTNINGTKYAVGTTGLNPFMVSSSLGMGMEYSLTSKISLNLEPTFRYYLNPFGNTPGINIHPYSFGLFSGVAYKF